MNEARKLGVKTIALIDTDGNPSDIDLPIPGNDDAMRAIALIASQLADAAIEGKQGRTTGQDKGDGAGEPRRRSARSTFRADKNESPAPETAPETAPAETPAAPAETVAAAS